MFVQLCGSGSVVISCMSDNIWWAPKLTEESGRSGGPAHSRPSPSRCSQASSPSPSTKTSPTSSVEWLSSPSLSSSCICPLTQPLLRNLWAPLQLAFPNKWNPVPSQPWQIPLLPLRRDLTKQHKSHSHYRNLLNLPSPHQHSPPPNPNLPKLVK